MSHHPQILIHNLTYTTPNDQTLFKDLSLNFGAQKTGLIGKNGIGKSTLAKIITGELEPTSGNIQVIGSVAYCPQNLEAHSTMTIAEVFGVASKLAAYQRILNGSTDENDFTILNDDWNFQKRIMQHLHEFCLDNISLEKITTQLSGGERTRLLLAKTFAANPNILILDEPTNNLDLTSRTCLYHKISSWSNGLIVISHDRKLLELMDQIVELTTIDAKTYGGNFTNYVFMKNLEQKANQRHLEDAEKLLQKTSHSIQNSREKRDQRQSQGNQLRKSGSQAKLILDNQKQRSEKTQAKMAIHENQLLKQAQEKLITAKTNLEIQTDLSFELTNTRIANDKVILQIENLTFTYDDKLKPIISNFSFSIVGPKRIAIIGNNGTGKTTLIKLIQSKLRPTSGNIMVGANYISYLDQHATTLDPTLSILENFQNFNPNSNENQARLSLAKFLFRNQATLQLVGNLSGGEKLRALLACVLLSANPPQLIILDEPTNHLDLESITSIETALNYYNGAMLIISHDQTFLNNLKIDATINLR